MSSSLDAARSGMLSHQRNIDLIANNLANVNTTGYKRALVHFQDLLDTAGILAALNGEVPEGGVLYSSSGVSTTGVTRDFVQGTLRPTSLPLDFAIQGDGFFRIRLEDGSLAYTRSGAFAVDGLGRLVTFSGFLVEPPITFSEDIRDLRVGTDGTITAVRPYTAEELAALGPDEPRDGVRIELGRIELSRFVNPAGLESIGQSLYRATEESLEPIDGVPGEDGMGEVYNGFLEASNVDVGTEMTSLLLAARAYQLNLSAYRTIEQMLSAANDLA
jgi:flagellar basal-body rod protein FlgG